MRRKSTLLLMVISNVLILLNLSCGISQSKKTSEERLQQQKIESTRTMPQARPMTTDDPNFKPSWDWTKNEPYDLYYRDGGGVSPQPNVRLPYYSNSGPTSIFHSDIPGVRDISPQDGWVLLFRDFGTPTRPAEPPRIILYNRYRGILRLFFYNAHFSETFTYGVVALSRQSIALSRGFAAFTFNDPVHHTLNDFDKDRTEYCITKLEPLQWSYADFAIVGYDPILPADSKFSFQISGFKVGEISLSGELDLLQILNEGTNVGFSFDKAKNIAVEAFKMYKDVNGTVKDLKLAVDKANKDFKENNTPLPWYIPVIEKFVKNPTVAGSAPWLGAAAVVFEGIFGAATQPQPIKFEGQISLDGQIKFPSSIISFLMRVPGANHLGQDDMPFYDKPLGVFNLKTRPEILFSNSSNEHKVKCGNIHWDEPNLYFSIPLNEIEIEINPYSGVVDFEAALAPFPNAPDVFSPKYSDGFFPMELFNNASISEGSTCQYSEIRKKQQLGNRPNRDPIPQHEWKLFKNVNPGLSGQIPWFITREPLFRKLVLKATVSSENTKNNITPITLVKSHIPKYTFVDDVRQVDHAYFISCS